jgi:hypothetical protein
MYTDRKFLAYPEAKVYVVPYEEFQKMDLNDTETKHTCGQWVKLYEWPSTKAFYNHCALLHYGYERVPPRIIGTSDMPAFFMKDFKLRPEFFEINQNLSQCHTKAYEFWIEAQIEHFKGDQEKVRLDIDSFWDNHLGSYDDVEDFAESVESDPIRYELDVDVTGMTKEEMLSSEDFMSCFFYGGEHNYFFKIPNW